MKKLLLAISNLWKKLVCQHDYRFVGWKGEIASRMTESWSSETGWEDFRKQEVCCPNCKKSKILKVHIGGAMYGGLIYKNHEAAYIAR